MKAGWRYRAVSALGVAVLTALAVSVVNSPTVQAVLASVPFLNRLSTSPPGTAEGLIEVATTTVVVMGALLPLYKPRPRRILDAVVLAQKRVWVGLLALAAVGYFDYTYRLPRLTLLAVTPVLLVVLPAWFVWVRRTPSPESERSIVVGDDPAEIARLVADVDIPLLGYLCPT
ncbi:MAG: sugar transferase, partial [Haloferacaceae archaeon]